MAVKITNENYIPVGEAEEDYIGIDHGEVGKIALSTWNYLKIVLMWPIIIITWK